MAELGLASAVRGRSLKTNQPDPRAPCPQDRVSRIPTAKAEQRYYAQSDDSPGWRDLKQEASGKPKAVHSFRGADRRS